MILREGPSVSVVPRGDRGMTLLEVLVATSLLVVGMTGILALFTAATALVADAERRTDVALALPEALRRIEAIVAAPAQKGQNALAGEFPLTAAGGDYRVRYSVEEAGETGVLFAHVKLVLAAGTGNETVFDFGRLPAIPEAPPPGPAAAPSGAVR